MIQTALLVDDDPDIRMVGELVLASVGGWTTYVAGSGERALELARAHVPDVILLDVMMPTMDGPTTLEHLRSDPVTASIPVIFCTAKVQQREMETFRALGAAGVIPKPFDPMMLPQQVRDLVAAAT